MVLTIGLIIFDVVIVVGFIAMRTAVQQNFQASLAGTLPRMEEKSGWQSLTTDQEGEHHYIVEKSPGQSGEVASVWDRLTYSRGGRDAYVLKRRKNGMFITGMDALTHRYILYDLKCTASPKQYAVIKVFEVSRDKKTLDYGKTGSQKDWEDVPEGTVIDKLAKASCAEKKQ